MSTAAISGLSAQAVSGPEKRDTRGRLRGLDSIRAVCALIVAFGHLSLFSEADLHSSNHVIRSAARLSAAAWNGPSAVIVFFIISGFCIHLPFRGDRPMQLAPFLSRRLLRVGIPAILAYCFARYMIHGLIGLYVVIWSVICEILYYLLYPLFLPIARRIGWSSFFVGGYIVSLVLALTHLQRLAAAHNGYDALGTSLTWLIGLPCWLLGCWLAETERTFPLLSPPKMWLLRGGIFSITVVLRILKFHVHSVAISNVFTLNLFAILACIWLGFEITYNKHHEPSGTLERLGTWSYSLYLVHTQILFLAVSLGWLHRLTLAFHGTLLVSALCLAYIFHWVVEYPSHRLAIFVSRKV